ncbi:uncharacterized protein BYT42DRAFT_553045 [Radiomyces spectabilis]|uniref:uncharacterized protein n=1 Tax=Radiomyces spectabilis TaxID=64574 RepID=UPI00222046C7|nr:uncharacterized protein BYT42DRAFT_553045 [Radiomyces spectabilis]KAI8394016.1 hypothetical protein BYT42DRAFT_553045 [Radiomyces spectabilis]
MQHTDTDDFSSDLDAYLEARDAPADEKDWELDSTTQCYVNHKQRLLLCWTGNEWAYGDYNASYGSSDHMREENDMQQSPSLNEATRYLYDEKTDLWYDTLSSQYYKYDDVMRIYIPVTVINDQDEWTDEPESDATLRLVVLESDKLKAGHVVLVDAQGLTVGRDKSWDKRLRLPEMAVSKFHCQIFFDAEAASFHVTDVGSQNGTFLNSERLSDTKTSSVPFKLQHKDQLQIGSTVLEVHQHEHGWPCEQCRTNDNIIDTTEQSRKSQPDKVTVRQDLEVARRQELQRLKQKFSTVESKSTQRASYLDRANLRRQQQPAGISKHSRVPVQEEYETVHTPVAAATVHTPVHGVGDRMLRKMGWKQGQGLGKPGSGGILEPIAPVTTSERAGLGSRTLNSAVVGNESRKARDWRLAQERFKQL